MFFQTSQDSKSEAVHEAHRRDTLSKMSSASQTCLPSNAACVSLGGSAIIGSRNSRVSPYSLGNGRELQRVFGCL